MSVLFLHSVDAESEMPCLISILKALRKNNPEKNITLVVPENMTLEYEQALMRDREGMIRVTVKSPKKLQSTVLDIYGYGEEYKNQHPIIVSRAGMIAKTFLCMVDAGDELRYCKSSHIASAEKIYDTIRELTDAGYNMESLQKLSEVAAIPPLLRDKLHDVILLFNKVKERSEHSIDEEDLYWLACNHLLKQSRSNNSETVFCGFGLLTKKLIHLAFSLAGNGEAHMIFLNPDEASDNDGVFAELKNSIKNAKKIAEKDNAYKITDKEWHEEKSEFDEGISYLASLVLGKHKECPSNLNNITVYNAPSQYAECLHAAQQLIEWHNDGCDWKKLGVVINVGDISTNILALTLEAAHIPYFLVSHQVSTENAAVNYLLKVVRASYKYSRQDMIDITKSGFLPFTDKEASLLENYAYAHGITGKKWAVPFNGKLPVSADLENLRQRLVAPIQALHECLASRGNNAVNQAKAIWEYINKTGLYEKLREKENEYRTNGFNHYADQTRQSWHVVCKMLNTVATETTDKHISMENLIKIITKCLEEEKMKSIPQTADAVLVDDANVFLPGMRDNCILLSMQEKAIVPNAGILTAADKRWMEANDAEVKVNPMFGLLEEEVIASKKQLQRQYKAIMSAKKKLVLSCASFSHKGEPLLPDSLIKRASELLKGKNPENIRGGIFNDDLVPFSRDAAIELLAQKIRDLVFHGEGSLSEKAKDDASTLWKKAYDYFKTAEPEIIQKVLYSLNAVPHAENIPEEDARELFVSSITSVSELENFAACPYAHFIKYGIKPTEIKDFIFQADQQGTFYHAAMKAYIETAGKDPAFPNIDQKTIIKYFNEAVAPLVDELKDSPLSENTLSRMELSEYVQTVRVSAMYVTFWLAETKYMPRACEASFGRADSLLPPLVLKTSAGKNIVLAGSIDRYDVYRDKNGVEYGRVVDYKSSAHTLDKEDVEGGYQLQLPLYLQTLVNANPGMKPAGAFYQRIANKPVDIDSEDEDEVRKKVLSSTKLDGMYLVTEDEELQKASGGSVKTSTRSNSIMSLTEPEFDAVLKHSQEKATEHAENIDHGVISITPRQDGDKSACDYCEARNICEIANRDAFGGKA